MGWKEGRSIVYTRDQGWEWASAGGGGERYTQKHAAHSQALARGIPLVHTLSACQVGDGR